jgi:hypothetical protein
VTTMLACVCTTSPRFPVVCVQLQWFRYSHHVVLCLQVLVRISGYGYGTTNHSESGLTHSVATIGPMSACVATGGWDVRAYLSKLLC